MNELSLFTGAGGGLLGTKLLGWKTVGYVENNDYCQKIIAQRIKDGIFDPAPIFGDIRTFLRKGYARSYQGMVDIITAGFPCQPFSVAGKHLGEKDQRNLWPETLRCIQEIRPQYLLLENVPGLLSAKTFIEPQETQSSSCQSRMVQTHAEPIWYMGTILADLAQSGYDARWDIVGASDIGANHRRKRLWIMAHTQLQPARMEKHSSRGQERQSSVLLEPEILRQENRQTRTERIRTSGANVAHTFCQHDDRSGLNSVTVFWQRPKKTQIPRGQNLADPKEMPRTQAVADPVRHRMPERRHE
jgi:DNA (cytosine-5)-methyltransferase 1